MENSLLQRRILEYLYDQEKQFPSSKIRITSLPAEFKKSFKEICSSINILNKNRYIFLCFMEDEGGKLVDADIAINKRGIQLIEDKQKFNQEFSLEVQDVANFIKYLLSSEK